MLTVGSLFSGIGGLDLGLERAGMRVLWQCESDPYCRAVLRKHWPAVPCYEDITTLVADSEGIGRDHGAAEDVRATTRDVYAPGDSRPVQGVDVLCGGFPCQPVSLAGARRGNADERWLWPEFARLIRLLRPRYALMENVPGLLVGGGMAEVLGDLAACGYDAEWDCIPAAAVGAPHLRYRVFIVAYANGGRQQGERVGGLLDGERPAQRHNADGRDSSMADSSRVQQGRTEQRTQRQRARMGGKSTDAADSDGSGRFEQRRPESVFAQLTAPERRSWWESEPDVGRVAHGVPSRVDRLRALGNAVVPQVAEAVGRAIVAAHNGEVA